MIFTKAPVASHHSRIFTLSVEFRIACAIAFFDGEFSDIDEESNRHLWHLRITFVLLNSF
jgi:hypothetical protein